MDLGSEERLEMMFNSSFALFFFRWRFGMVGQEERGFQLGFWKIFTQDVPGNRIGNGIGV